MFSRELLKAWASKLVNEVVKKVEINREELNRKQTGLKGGDKSFDPGRGVEERGGNKPTAGRPPQSRAQGRAKDIEGSRVVVWEGCRVNGR